MKSGTGWKMLLASMVLSVGACAGKGPIIDTQGVDQARYQQDLAECQAYAEQVDTGAQTGKSAVAGGVIGAAIGAIAGNSSSVAKGAGVGAVAGGARGAVGGQREQQQVVRNCLRGRGYRVLN